MCMGAPSAPPDRNYAQETRDTLQAQVDLAPQQYASESQFQPKYADLANQITQNTLTGAPGSSTPGLLQYYRDTAQPLMGQIASTANTQSRTADINDLTNLGGQAVSAIKAANPEQQAMLARINSEALGQAEDPLVTQMRQQAAEELGRGASLDPSLARQVQQSARAGQAARGFGYSMPDLNQEALFTGQAAEQLRQNRRAFAGNVAGLSQQGQAQRYGQLLQAGQMNAATAVDPMMAILGRSSMAYNPNMIGQQSMNTGGAKLFNPESAYAGDIYNTNYNAHAAAKIAGANNNAALIGAGISAVGSIGSSA